MGAQEVYAARRVIESDNPTSETTWHVWVDADHPTIADEAAAAVILAPLLPAVYNFSDGRKAILQSVEIADITEQWWSFRVLYARLQRREKDATEYEFDIGLTDVNITHAAATTAYTGPGRVAPNFQRGINIDADGTVQGISAGQPTASFTIKKYWDIAAITPAYRKALYFIVGRYNNKVFSGLDPGECRLMGATGRATDQLWPITYRFDVIPNSVETVGDITGIQKLGHQYLDILRYTIFDPASEKKIEVPHSVYVHDLPNSGPADFDILGL
jgi:hypothetical protein